MQRIRALVISDAELTSDIADFPKAIFHFLLGLTVSYLSWLKIMVNSLNFNSLENGHCSRRITSSIAVDKINPES